MVLFGVPATLEMIKKSIQVCMFWSWNGQNISEFDAFNQMGGYLLYECAFSWKIANRSILFSEYTT